MLRSVTSLLCAALAALCLTLLTPSQSQAQDQPAAQPDQPAAQPDQPAAQPDQPAAQHQPDDPRIRVPRRPDIPDRYWDNYWRWYDNDYRPFYYYYRPPYGYDPYMGNYNPPPWGGPYIYPQQRRSNNRANRDFNRGGGPRNAYPSWW